VVVTVTDACAGETMVTSVAATSVLKISLRTRG
jgi:hypothetical protein